MNKFYQRILSLSFLPKAIKIGIIVLINWVFQSILYVDKTERFFKIFLDIILWIVFYYVLRGYFSWIPSLVLSFLTAHTINWLFNGNFFTLLKNFFIVKTSPEKFSAEIKYLSEKTAANRSVLASYMVGSILQSQFKDTSDLDIRFIRKKGILHGIKAFFLLLYLRNRALFSAFPLDIYMFDSPDRLFELKPDEKPVILFDPTGLITRQ